MPKNESNEAAAATTSKIAPPAISAETAAAGDSRSIMIEVKMQDGSTQQMRRTDYCRQRWADGASRGQIAKELTELTGKKVAYQVVFAATKGLPGGPAKSEPAEAGEE